MIYFVIELQTTNGTGASLTYTYSDRNQADQKFYEIMAAASVSAVDKHGAMLLDEDLDVLKSGLAFRRSEEPEE